MYYDLNTSSRTASVTYLNGSSTAEQIAYVSGNVTIPSSITVNGTAYTVTSIGDAAFRSCAGMRSISIPNTITSIGWYAFGECSGLTSLTLPSSLKTIGEEAIYCVGLTTLYVNATTPPSLGANAFRDAPITIVHVPAGCKSTYQSASGWSSLSNIDDGTSTGSSVSMDGGNFGNLVLGKALLSSNYSTSLTEGAKVAFYGDGQSDRKGFLYEDANSNVLMLSANSSTLGQTNVFTVHKSSSGYYFASNSGLYIPQLQNSQAISTNVTPGYFSIIPTSTDGIFNIIGGSLYFNVAGDMKFTGWDESGNNSNYRIYPIVGGVIDENFTIYPLNFHLQNGSATIVSCNSSYSGNMSIPSVVSYNGKTYPLTAIGKSAFKNCSGLITVTIPTSITTIGTEAFSGCSALTKMNVSWNSPIALTDFASYFSGINSSCALYVPKSLVSTYQAAAGWSGFASVTYVKTMYVGTIQYYKSDNTLLSTTTSNIEDGGIYSIPSGKVNIGGKSYQVRSVTVNGAAYTQSTYVPSSAFTVKVYLTTVSYVGSITYYDLSNKVIATETTNVSDGAVYTVPMGTYISGAVTYPIKSIKLNDATYTQSIYSPTANFSVGVYLGAPIEEMPDNVLYINDTAAVVNSRIILPIRLKNLDSEITAFQFDLSLPAGFSVALDAKDKYAFALAGRTAGEDYTVSSKLQSDGTVRVVLASLSNAAIAGHDGVILNVAINVADGTSGHDYTLALKNLIISNTSAVKYKVAEMDTKIKVRSYLLGDPNSDGEIDVSDAVSIISYILDKSFTPFVFEAGDINSDGDIDVSDAVGVINLILNSGSASSKAIMATDYSKCTLETVPFAIEPGETKTIAINMNNAGVDDLTALQTDITLPAGVNITKSGTKYSIAKTGRDNNHSLSSKLQTSGAVRVTLVNFDLDPITGEGGSVLNVTIKADDNIAAGVYNMTLSGSVLSSTSAAKFKPADYMASVFSGDLSKVSELPQLYGDYTVSAIAALNGKLAANAMITSVDLSNASDIASTSILSTANANTLFYLPDSKSTANAQNVVSGTSCAKLQLIDNYPFAASKAFTASSASYKRTTSSAGWYTLCLPFATSIPNGVDIEKFASVDKVAKTVTFTSTNAPQANMPYIFKTASSGDITFSATNVEVPITSTLTDGDFVGIFTSLTPGTNSGKYLLKEDGKTFVISSSSDLISPFHAYLSESDSAQPYTLIVGGTSGIESPTNGLEMKLGHGEITLTSQTAREVVIVSMDSKVIAHFTLAAGESRTVNVMPAIYCVNGQCIQVK